MKFMLNKIGAVVLGVVMMANIAAGEWIAQSGDIPITFDQTSTTDNIQVLMAAGAAQNGGMTVKLDTQYPKHFWIQDFDDTSDILQWSVNLETAGYYHVDALLSADAGESFSLSVVETGTTLNFTQATSGWTKQEAGVILIPSGTSVLRLVRTSATANVEIKSLELILDSDRAAYLQRVADFKVDTTWFSQSGYGLMFQYGNWGYPETGGRKSLEDQTNDFDVPAFVSMVEDSGASYVIWSITWRGYVMNAPIESVDAYFGNGDLTSNRDLIGEIMDALDAKGIDFMLYYHRGEAWAVPWFLDESYPKEEFTSRGTGDRSVFFDSWETVITEIGNRYGDKLDGWFFDDGVVYYPAPFERLGAAVRAGNPNRLISYNPWIATRVTDFQDVTMGEAQTGEPRTGSADPGGDGILTDGPSAGMLQHGMFTLNNGWGIYKEDQTITTRYNDSQLIGIVETASSINVPVSICINMWEDGSISPDTSAVLAALKQSMEPPTETSGTNLALNQSTSQSSTSHGGLSSRAVDGDTNGDWDDGSVTHTAEETNAWWEVDLGFDQVVREIKIYNRSLYRSRLSDFTVSLINSSGTVMYSQSMSDYPDPSLTVDCGGALGSIVRIQLNGMGVLSLAEVEVYGDGLVGYWPLDDGSGTVVSDLSGYEYDGTVTSGNWVTGINGGALEFDGSSSLATLPASAFASVSDEITVSMWVDGDATQPRSDSVFYATDASGNRMLNIHLPWSDSKVYWDAGDSGFDRISKAASPSEYMGTWNHWVFTKNATNGEMNIYLNGSLWHTGTGKVKTMNGVSEAVLGGQLSGFRYDGTIDDVRLYDQALNAQEVATLFETYRMSGIPVDWLSTYGLSITDSVASDNPDGDALVNFAEYALGGMPTDATNTGYPVSIETLQDGETNWFEVVYQRRIGSEEELSYSLETSTTLLPDSWTMATYVEVSVDETSDANFESVTNRIEVSGGSHVFIRLKIDSK